MNHSKIGVRYAKALIETAQSQGILENVYQDVINIEPFFKNDSSILIKVLLNPIMKKHQKISLLNRLFQPHIEKLTLQFLQLILAKGREEYIKDIFRNFIFKYNEINKIKNVAIITTIEPDKEIVEKITRLIHKIVPNEYKINLNDIKNDEIIGGFILEVGDYQLDASIKGKLNQIKSNLINTSHKIKL